MSAPIDYSNHHLQALNPHSQDPPFLSDPKSSYGFSIHSIPPARIPTDIPSQRRARDKSSTWTILLLGVVIWVPTVAGLTCLLLYILFMSRFYLEGYQHIVSTARFAYVLGISSALQNIVSKAIGLVLMIEAYSVGSKWIQASNGGQRTRRDQPTPLQLALTVNLLQSGSLRSWFSAGSYTVKARSKARPAVPGMMRRAVWISSLIILSGIWIVVSDTVLHWTSTPFSTQTLTALQRGIDRGEWSQLSLGYNETRCDDFMSGWNDSATEGTDLYFNKISATCGLRGSAPTMRQFTPTARGFLQTLRGVSRSSRVLTGRTSEGLPMAILVPAQTGGLANLSWTGTSPGVSVECESVTENCIRNGSYGPNAGLTLFPCQGLDYALNATDLEESAFYGAGGLIGPDGMISRDFAQNPFRYAKFINSAIYLGPEHEFINDTGFFPHGNAGANNVLSCQVSVWDARYRFYPDLAGTQGHISIISHSLANWNKTQRMNTMTDSPWSPGIYAEQDAEGAGLLDGTSYTGSFATGLARAYVASQADAMIPLEAEDIERVKFIIGSRLNLPALASMVVSTTIFVLLLTYVMISALTRTSRLPWSSLAQSLVSDSLPHMRIAHCDKLRSEPWSSDALAFGSEDEGDRLRIGVVDVVTGDSYGSGYGNGVVIREDFVPYRDSP